MFTTSHLFLEAYGPAAQRRLGQLIAVVKRDNLLSPVTVVVPTTYAGLSLRRSLAKKDGLVNVRFMTLPRLAEYLGAPTLAKQGKSPLSPIMKLLAIRHFAKDMATKEPLGAIAGHPPLHNYLAGTFADLSTLSEDSLSALESRSELLKQVGEWYRLYRSLIVKYYDREELAQAAADAVAKGKATSVLKDIGFIIVYLVASFSPGESALLSALSMNNSCAVILGLTGEEDVDAEAQRLAHRLEPILGKAEVSPPEAGIYCADGIAITPDAQEEVRHVLRHIAGSAEDGTPFHCIAVLYRNADPYASLVKNQLELASIPLAGPNPLPIRDTPAGKLLVYMLEVFETDFARESVMRWVAETPVRTEKDGALASREVALWEAISGKAGIINGTQQWQERLDNFCRGMQEKMDSSKTDENGEPIGTKYFEIRKASAIRLKSFVAELAASPPPPDGSSWRDYADWSGKLMKKYAANISWPKEQQDNYDRVTASLDELGRLDEIEPAGTTLADFRQMLDDCLKAASGRTGLTGAGVFVAPVSAVQGMTFEAVYILGMTEGAFPPTLPDDAIIPDRYRNELGSGDLLPLRAVRRINERRIFRAAMATAHKRLISHPRSGGAGQRRGYPSPWLVREAEALHQKVVEAAKGTAGKKPAAVVSSANLEEFANEPWLSVIHSTQHGLKFLPEMGLVPADTHDYDMHSIAKWHAAGHRVDRHFLMAEGKTGHRAQQMEHGRKGDGLTAWDGNIIELVGKSARLGIPEDKQFSPTRLELWAKCPFQYFVRHVLEIPVLDRPEEITEISPIDRGSLVHSILERFMVTVREIKKEPEVGEPWTADHKKLLMEIAEEEFKKVETLGITGKPLLWKVAQHEIREDLSVFLEKDSKLRAENMSRPVEIERKFGLGKKGGYPPVVLTTKDGHQISFRGIIDRVDADASRSRLWVMDYKTGSTYPYKDMKEDNLLGAGRHLQLPVYALAVRNQFGGTCDVKAMYWFVTTKGNFEMKTVALSEVEEDLGEIVRIIASGIERGLFPANPGISGESNDNCTYCDYECICPANCDIAWERKSQDPQLSEYVGMSRKQDAEEEED